MPTTTLPSGMGLAQVITHATSVTGIDAHHMGSSTNTSFPQTKTLPSVCQSQIVQNVVPRRAHDARVSQSLLKDSLLQAARQEKPCVSLPTGQKLSQTSDASSSSVCCANGHRHDDISFMSVILSQEAKWTCPNHDSALISYSGSGALALTADRHVWTATETLNVSTLFPRLLPQNCNHREGSLSRRVAV